MIVQCEACQTRFRLADEKIKPDGTKVRCSKCKEVFTVMPPEPEPAEETVDFGSFNMEAVPGEPPGKEGSDPEGDEAEEEQPEPAATEPPDAAKDAYQFDDNGFDFDTPTRGAAEEPGTDTEPAGDFSFGDDDQQVAKQSGSDEEDEQTDAFTEEEFPETTGLAEGAYEFNFTGDEEPEAADSTSSETGEFSFDTDNVDESDTFGFEKSEAEEAASAADTEPEATPEYSFDEDTFSDPAETAEWDDEPAGEITSFDFDQPEFDSDEVQAKRAGADDESGLLFGEIDFAGESSSGPDAGSATDDFSKITIDRPDEPDPFQQNQQGSSSDHAFVDRPLSSPPVKKSSLARILSLLIFLFVVLGGAAGYLYLQEGTLNMHVVARYLPFLKDYIGEDPATGQVERIGINIIETYYLNGQSGQMLVIQGNAVNNYPTIRSAITLKGILLDDKGRTLLQQTIFCGNRLDNDELKNLSFSAIEEAMNNQFGDRLTNMNVAAGAAIPFTIVFRNLPDGVASINVEVVESKPGAN